MQLDLYRQLMFILNLFKFLCYTVELPAVFRCDTLLVWGDRNCTQWKAVINIKTVIHKNRIQALKLRNNG